MGSQILDELQSGFWKTWQVTVKDKYFQQTPGKHGLGAVKFHLTDI